jgi:hypothetical protein
MSPAWSAVDAARIIGLLFQHSEHSILILLGHGLEILDCNRGFLRMAGLSDKPSGERLDKFLDGADAASIADFSPHLRPGAHFAQRMLFAGQGSGAHILEVQWFGLAQGALLFGEHPVILESEVLREFSRLNDDLINRNREIVRQKAILERAQKEIKTLKKMLPICSYCKGIRDDQGYWSGIEAYIKSHTGSDFSHGICPECARKHFPGLDLYGEEEPQPRG